MEMLLIKQLMVLPANSIAPDINTALRGPARLSMKLCYVQILKIDKSEPMKFVNARPCADPDAAAREREIREGRELSG
jgi:hypothetical protein